MSRRAQSFASGGRERGGMGKKPKSGCERGGEEGQRGVGVWESDKVSVTRALIDGVVLELNVGCK